MLQALTGLFDHIVNDLLGRFDILRHSQYHPKAHCIRGTHVDQSADVAHQPGLALEGLFRVLLELDVVWDLSLSSEFSTGHSISESL